MSKEVMRANQKKFHQNTNKKLMILFFFSLLVRKAKE